MTALEAFSAGVKDMADGSLRITIEFDPRYAKDAFALFGARGTPLAIAALKDGYAQQIDTSQEPVQKSVKNELGPLAKWAIIRCTEHEFFRFIDDAYRKFIGDLTPSDREFIGCLTPSDFKNNEEFCRHAVLVMCNCLESRKEIDEDPEKAELFQSRIRGPYMKHLQARGLV